MCRLPEKGRKEIEERVEEMKERDREERGTGMKVKKQKNFVPMYKTYIETKHENRDRLDPSEMG